MDHKRGSQVIPDRLWPLFLVALVAALLFVTVTSFTGAFRSYVPVTLASDRSGLVLDTGAKVKIRGVDIGRVSAISIVGGGARLTLQIDPDQIHYIPANVGAKIDVTTIFGAKFVDLVYPDNPSSQRLAAGAVLQSSNVTTEVNTVFDNLVDLLNMVDPLKLNAVLTATAEAVRGQGQRIGEATTDLNEVLVALNSRNDTIRADLRSLKNFGDTYNAAANDIMNILNAASTTSTTIVNNKSELDSVLLSVSGLSQAGTNLLGSSEDHLVSTVNSLAPTVDLLNMYSPEYACSLQGAKWLVDKADYVFGGDGKSFIVDATLLPGKETFVYPDNLPVVGAKGGPGGKPGCGSLPDVTKNFPVRQLITNTGWGTGVDIRPNPGIGQRCWANYFPVTRGIPQAASIRQCLPGPAPGPEPFPGAPPYGAPLYGPGGVPLWPGVGPAQPDSEPANQGTP